MEKIEVVILLGLQKYGRSKSFTEILAEAGMGNDKIQRLEAAYSLEAAGLIQNVLYQLPLTIHAELSAAGVAYVKSLQGNGGSGGTEPSVHNVLLGAFGFWHSLLEIGEKAIA
jgi:hypothetical protein